MKIFVLVILGFLSSIIYPLQSAYLQTKEVANKDYKLAVVDNLNKIFKFKSRIPLADAAKLYSAKNEYESFQILIDKVKKDLTNVTVKVSDLTNLDGKATIPNSSIKIRLVGYVPTKKPYYKTSFVGLWPDPLIELDRFDIKKGNTQALWITVYIPENTSAGEHKGKEIQKQQLKDADILVTGGTGFIGHRLVNKLLEKGYRVRVLTHRNLSDEELGSLFRSNVEIIHGEIYNYIDVEEACKGVDIVYHLAAAMRGDWNYYLDTTITGTKNVLEASTKMGVRHFVYVSTLNVYDAKQYPQNGLINEGFPYENIPERRGAYSHAKFKAEKVVREYADNKEMSISIIRPGLVYGPGREAFLKDAGMRLGRRLMVTLGGKRRLPLVYVDNLVDALLLAGNSRGKAKGIFNIVDNDYPTQREFIKTYKKLSGERFFTIYIPMWIMFSGFWMIERLLSVVIKKSPSLCYKLRCVNKSVRYSTERIEKMLGWSPRVNFKQGLKLTIQE